MIPTFFFFGVGDQMARFFLFFMICHVQSLFFLVNRFSTGSSIPILSQTITSLSPSLTIDFTTQHLFLVLSLSRTFGLCCFSSLYLTTTHFDRFGLVSGYVFWLYNTNDWVGSGGAESCRLPILGNMFESWFQNFFV